MALTAGWTVERVLHFAPDDFLQAGLAHFGFHLSDGSYYGIAHQKHFGALVGDDGRPVWTVAPAPVFRGVPNIAAELEHPMFVDGLPDGSLVVSNFGNARVYRIDPRAMTARLLVEGQALGLVDMGNCVVDEEGCIWVNEVRGCRLWRFDPDGRPLETIGDGHPGYQDEPVGFDDARFSWIYDIRRGPDGRIYVLDSRNFALRVLDFQSRRLLPVADGFASDPSAEFDGPISLALDDEGNAYVGDRFAHVVRMVEPGTGRITTIAGRAEASEDVPNDPAESDPLRLNLPMISSMDYHAGRLYVPTDLVSGSGDLAVLRTVVA